MAFQTQSPLTNVEIDNDALSNVGGCVSLGVADRERERERERERDQVCRS
jgi:hypothetical protein